jgi:hypothetical protein
MAKPKKTKGGPKPKKQKSVALIFGENPHDTDSIKELLIALHPQLDGRLRARREPTKELKHSPLSAFPDKVKKTLAVVDVQRAVDTIRCLVVHEDCDAVENAHVALTSSIESAYSTAGCPAFAATPAWELEAWWFLWPDCAKLRASWRLPDDHVGKNVGKIVDAKEVFAAAVVPKGLKKAQKVKFPGYCEADSVAIARGVRQKQVVSAPQAQSGSFKAFEQRAAMVAAALP